MFDSWGERMSGRLLPAGETGPTAIPSYREWVMQNIEQNRPTLERIRGGSRSIIDALMGEIEGGFGMEGAMLSSLVRSINKGLQREKSGIEESFAARGLPLGPAVERAKQRAEEEALDRITRATIDTKLAMPGYQAQLLQQLQFLMQLLGPMDIVRGSFLTGMGGGGGGPTPWAEAGVSYEDWKRMDNPWQRRGRATQPSMYVRSGGSTPELVP